MLIDIDVSTQDLLKVIPNKEDMTEIEGKVEGGMNIWKVGSGTQ